MTLYHTTFERDLLLHGPDDRATAKDIWLILGFLGCVVMIGVVLGVSISVIVAAL